MEVQKDDSEQTGLIQPEEFEIDPTFKPPSPVKEVHGTITPIHNITMSIRSGMSVRHGAKIANSTLIDYGIATPGRVRGGRGERIRIRK